MKKLFSIIIICLIAISITSCDIDSTKKADSDSKSDKKIEKETAKKYPKSWKKKVDWADDKDYMIAVGIKDYDGDILQPGNYIFKSNLTKKKIESKEKKGQTPVVWDIYVSKNQYKNKRELKKSEFVGSVGGTTIEELNIKLEEGQYVYVNYIKPVGKGFGKLEIRLNKDDK